METMIAIIEYGAIIITTSIVVGFFCVILYWIGLLIWYIILEDAIKFIKDRFLKSDKP